MKRADGLARISGAKVYLLVLFCGQYFTYSSHCSKAWPPSQDEIVCTLELQQVLRVSADRQIGSELPPSLRPPVQPLFKRTDQVANLQQAVSRKGQLRLVITMYRSKVMWQFNNYGVR